MATRFIIAEDNDFFLETITQMLAALEGRYTCVGKARNGAEALALVAQRAPDLLILDLRMPRLDGFNVLDALRGGKPSPKILVLTMSHSSGMMQKALRLGADGYCTKTCGRAVFLKAVERVATGHRFISPDIH
jgi:DNA-binding NarL/FixJ family response regulator